MPGERFLGSRDFRPAAGYKVLCGSSRHQCLVDVAEKMNAKVAVLFALVAATVAHPQYSYDPPTTPYSVPSTTPPSFYSAPSRSPSSYRATSRPAESADSSSEDPAQYDTQYTVRDEESGNNFGHQETRDGDVIEGTYYVQLPDGRMQIVNYYVTPEDGYVAEVTYEGETTGY